MQELCIPNIQLPRMMLLLKEVLWIIVTASLPNRLVQCSVCTHFLQGWQITSNSPVSFKPVLPHLKHFKFYQEEPRLSENAQLLRCSVVLSMSSSTEFPMYTSGRLGSYVCFHVTPHWICSLADRWINSGVWMCYILNSQSLYQPDFYDISNPQVPKRHGSLWFYLFIKRTR